MPYFSIIIPVYNKAKFVHKTVSSVLSQSFDDYEIIIINDGSTDESEKEIRQFNDNRIQYYKTENQGVAKARNFGFTKAKSEFICFLDADDFWYPNFLETFHFYIQKNPNEKVFSSLKEIETASITIIPEYSFEIKNDFEIVDFFKASRKECVLWTSNTIIHKSVLDKVGCFDTNIKHGEDTELWIRIGLKYKVVFISKVLARYVYDQNSISRDFHYHFEPYTFQKYEKLETENRDLKLFMDLNRYSAILKCKMNGEWKTANEIYTNIDLKNLSWKKSILLQLPAFCLKVLLRFKIFLNTIGLSKSVFR